MNRISRIAIMSSACVLLIGGAATAQSMSAPPSTQSQVDHNEDQTTPANAPAKMQPGDTGHRDMNTANRSSQSQIDRDEDQTTPRNAPAKYQSGHHYRSTARANASSQSQIDHDENQTTPQQSPHN